MALYRIYSTQFIVAVFFFFLLLLFPAPRVNVASSSPLCSIRVYAFDWTEGNKITLSGFGVFQTRSRAGRTGRNPRTGEPLEIKASTLPVFTPAKSFKEQVCDVPPHMKLYVVLVEFLFFRSAVDVVILYFV